MSEEEKKAPETKSGRKTALIVCIVLIVAVFVAHYALKGTCTQADALNYYLIMTLLPQIGNSGILFTLLWWFGEPLLKGMVADRKRTIEVEIDECTKLKEAAEAKCAEIEQKSSTLSAEKQKLERSYREAAEVESKRIAEEAKLQAERIRKDAEMSFELQSNVARSAFESEIKDEAIERAKAEIIRRIAADSSLRDRLIDESIASLEI